MFSTYNNQLKLQPHDMPCLNHKVPGHVEQKVVSIGFKIIRHYMRPNRKIKSPIPLIPSENVLVQVWDVSFCAYIIIMLHWHLHALLLVASQCQIPSSNKT